MADLFLINPGDYIDFLRKLNISEDRESSFNKDQHAARFLTLLFDQINRPINAVLEEYYIDDDYLDLYSNYYAFSYQENTKFSKRVLLLDCSFADCNQFYNYWYSASENELSKKVLAVFVIPDSSNKHISKAYIDPNILLNKPYSKIILSSIKIDILGKRIHINVFPFRQTDSELLTYSEVSIQGVFDYYYNMNKGFNKVYLSSLLNTKQELSKIRGLYHGNGMDVRDICSVFRQKGFETIYCDINTTSLGYARVDKSKMLINMIYPYVASGYPCLLHVNFGPGQDYLGHCVNIIGVVEKSNYCINEKTVLRLIGPGEYN